MGFTYFIILLWCIGFFGGIYVKVVAPARRWSKAPTIDEYSRQNPEAKTPHGMACASCGSRSIRNWGIIDAKSRKRLHICNHCGKTLYRSKA